MRREICQALLVIVSLALGSTAVNLTASVRLAAAVLVSGQDRAFAQAPQTPAGRGGRGGTGRAAGQGQDQDTGQARGRGADLDATADFSPRPPVTIRTPAEELKTFWLPQGFVMEPVLTDPDIQDPGVIAFDGNGRMFVAELRSYMQDTDGTGRLDPVSRISVHTDRDHDGVYETHQTFVDHIVFPRFLMTFGGGSILTMESNSDDVWKYTDTDGDSVADKKELFASGFGRLANLEHQQSGLFWALDNWMYSTINQFRVRWTPKGLLREPTASNRSQWGATQDNYGKPYFQAGSSGMPGYFQFPIHYGEFVNPQQFEPNLTTIWGAAVLVADMQGGMGAVRMPDGSLRSGTGGAGNDIFRGDRMPKDMIGDYFYGEVVGRVVRRLRVVNVEGLSQMRNVYPQSEFIRSTDPLFRPVDMTTAPDGTLYITDMYHGIIQDSAWTGPGTYLRSRIEQYSLDRAKHHGRIWRVRYAGIPRDPVQPRMLNETPAQLVTHLAHPNGWWRDTAQQLLVLKQDRSVVPALTRLVRSSTNQLARIHALWTLEGLGAAQASLLRTLLSDSDSAIRIQALRVSETLYKAGDRSFISDYDKLARDQNVDVVIQALLTATVLKAPGADALVRAARDRSSSQGVQLVAKTILEPADALRAGGNDRGLPPALTPAQQAIIDKGKTIYGELCFACHGVDGRGEVLPGAAAGTTRAPALAGSPRVLGHRDYTVNVLMNGLTGPLEGAAYTEVMIPMRDQSDEWIANVASYVRWAFGNYAPGVSVADVTRIRKNLVSRSAMWTFDELSTAVPRQVQGQERWNVTASHHPETAARATSLLPWVAGAQTTGMWLQVELPMPVNLTEVQFESSAGDMTVVMGAVADAAAAGFAFGGLQDQARMGYPRTYEVRVSTDGTTWSAPVATGKGTGQQTTITFAPTRARFLRITLTAGGPTVPDWTVSKLRLFEKP